MIRNFLAGMVVLISSAQGGIVTYTGNEVYTTSSPYMEGGSDDTLFDPGEDGEITLSYQAGLSS